ncbi:MAG: 4Fe-4S binding protein [Chlorobiota bacterium]|nr:4Fe-4S binding protein [Chlorobiota bacterium]QQS67738.1 MAG: 4Fe-4S binding protein [Chlorobiota bacterium]
MNHDVSFQLTGDPTFNSTKIQKVALILIGIGSAFIFSALFGLGSVYPVTCFVIGYGGLIIGGMLFIFQEFKNKIPGIKNNGVMFNSATAKGAFSWILGIFLTTFYIILYWFGDKLSSLNMTLDWLSFLIRNKPSDQWFLYGVCYSLAVLIMGIRMILKYKHSPYQIRRTLSVMFFQLFFAFLIPHLLELFNQKEFYFTYFWPLKYQYFFPNDIKSISESGGLGVFMVRWSMAMSFIGVPILTYFFGKRWYCSWVCGCGGLAETLGDPFRQLSDKSVKAWKIERWMIHTILLIIIITTTIVWINSATKGSLLEDASDLSSKWYGFFIGSLFSGVIGVGFYPIMGSRVWCRFGCPQAAILGIIQKYFSRFRITTNGGQCISCGNCSTYCEMGIDVRSYAQRGENIIRSSCVGCGICSAVCPRGVLNLENGPINSRYNGEQLTSNYKLNSHID